MQDIINKDHAQFRGKGLLEHAEILGRVSAASNVKCRKPYEWIVVSLDRRVDLREQDYRPSIKNNAGLMRAYRPFWVFLFDTSYSEAACITSVLIENG